MQLPFPCGAASRPGTLSAMADASLTEAFAQALDSAPSRWPRTRWLRDEVDSTTAEFVNGDFKIVLCRTSDGWTVRQLLEANAIGRRLWWIWVVPGLAVVGIGMVVIAKGHNAWWLGGAAVAMVVMGRLFFSEAHRRRRGGSREPVPPLYEE